LRFVLEPLFVNSLQPWWVFTKTFKHILKVGSCVWEMYEML
jgi:hypothetical protein